MRQEALGSTATAHTQHLLPGAETIPSHPASLSPPAFLSPTSHPATLFPACFYTEDLNKETKGKYVCGADVKFTAHAMTIPLAPYFIPPLHTAKGPTLRCTVQGLVQWDPASAGRSALQQWRQLIVRVKKGGFAQKEEACVSRTW